jgi:hypothetical protein
MAQKKKEKRAIPFVSLLSASESVDMGYGIRLKVE